MKIGVLRFNGPFELDWDVCSPTFLGVELRWPILIELAKRFSKVDVLSWTNQDYIFYNRHTMLRDYSFFPKNVTYNYNENILQYDMLFIECGPPNTRFSAKDGKSYIKRVADVLRANKGITIVYYHHMHSSAGAFPFKVFDKEAGSSSPLNLSNIFKGLRVEDYHWVLWSHAQDKAVFERQCGYTGIFKKHIISPLGYFPPLQNINTADVKSVDFVIAATCRTEYRNKMILETLDTLAKVGLSVSLVGPGWSIAKDYYLGDLPSFASVESYLNKSFTSLHVADKCMLENGVLTTRLVQTVLCGAITFYYPFLSKMYGNYFGSEMLVNNSIELALKIKQLRENKELVGELRSKQQNMLKTWEEIWKATELNILGQKNI